MSKEDFTTMYVKYPKGEITLWCDGHSDEGSDTCTSSRKKHKKDGEASTKRQEKEDEVDDMFMQLKEKHGVQNSTLQGYDSGLVQYAGNYMMIWTIHQTYQHSMVTVKRLRRFNVNPYLMPLLEQQLPLLMHLSLKTLLKHLNCPLLLLVCHLVKSLSFA